MHGFSAVGSVHGDPAATFGVDRAVERRRPHIGRWRNDAILPLPEMERLVESVAPAGRIVMNGLAGVDTWARTWWAITERASASTVSAELRTQSCELLGELIGHTGHEVH
jgi:hypothetical protein